MQKRSSLHFGYVRSRHWRPQAVPPQGQEALLPPGTDLAVILTHLSAVSELEPEELEPQNCKEILTYNDACSMLST